MAKRAGNRKRAKTEHTLQHRQPKIVDHVSNSDDEEIPEDEAFNSDDERLYGHFFRNDDGNDEKSAAREDSEDDSVDEAKQADEDDDGQYMLGLLDKLDTSRDRIQDSSATSRMMDIPESEYSNSISNKSLTLDKLMEGLHDTQGFKELQKTFQKRNSATPAPMEKVKADREQRIIAYTEQVKNISGWTKVVQENRQAETLDFTPKERLEVTRESLISKFQSKNDFEKELEQALEAAGQEDEDRVLGAEERALQDDLGANLLSMEEYKKRRGQLAQIRALMFYHEQKRHHMKKIKSKKYRRIRKKQRERAKESALDAAIVEDEELARELKEKEEVSRIQERMTLAHKNTSKWAKRILKRGKNVDMDTRKALSAQLKRGDDLRKKMLDKNDESESSSDEEDLVDSARKVLVDAEAGSPLPSENTGLLKLAFMQRGIQKQRDIAREEARKLLAELQANELEVSKTNFGAVSGASKSSEHVGSVASKKEMKQVLQEGEMIAKSLEFGKSNIISTNGGIDVSQDSLRFKSGIPVNDECAGQGEQRSASKCTSGGIIAPSRFPLNRNHTESGRSETATKASQITEAEEALNPWMGSSDCNDTAATVSNAQLSRTGRSGRRRKVDIDAAVDILDGSKEEKHTSQSRTLSVEDDLTSEGVYERQITLLNQEELVRRAFAAPSETEAEDNFRSEKEKMVTEADPGVEKTMPSTEASGWGSWTGMGAPLCIPRKLSKKTVTPKKQKEHSRKRKDDKKPDVIINQKRLKKTANGFMLGDVPHPFSCRLEYEQAMLGGVGREWNVSGAFKNMTRPNVLTQSGGIIKPISRRTKAKRAPAKF